METYKCIAILCDHLWENSAYRMKVEFDVWLISFIVEIQCFVCDRTTPPIWKIMVQRRCYARIWDFCILCVNRKSIKWTWAEPFKVKVKIKQRLIFLVHRLFFDAQEWPYSSSMNLQRRQKQNLCGEAHVRHTIRSHAMPCPQQVFCMHACTICFGMLHVDPTCSHKWRDCTYCVSEQECKY